MLTLVFYNIIKIERGRRNNNNCQFLFKKYVTIKFEKSANENFAHNNHHINTSTMYIILYTYRRIK